jgi:D-sedoheptulose 7-phosphate isomerase
VVECRKLGIHTVGLTGGTGGKLRTMVDHWLNVSASREAARIQETHILIGHAICQLVDAALYGGAKK